jgi:Baseplate J-like protein
MSAGALSPLAGDPAFRRQRRELLMASPRQTGVDWVELTGADAGRLHLKVHFVPGRDPAKKAIPSGIEPGNILVTAGSGLGAGFHADSVRDPRDGGTTLLVEIRASVEELAGGEDVFAVLEIQNLDGIDPQFARAGFSLATGKVAATDPYRPERAIEAPSSGQGIDYLAKDFQSFRRLMLDHMAAQAPEWRERHPADIGVVLVEILAYAGDYLSYFQDAIATEAYLSTARRRLSLRRHARMLDYRTYENCASRVWLQISVNADGKLQRGFRAFCDHPGAFPDRLRRAGAVVLPASGQAVFETIEDAQLSLKHNCLPLYDWGVRDFRVAAGATSAMLEGDFRNLDEGDVLIFAPWRDPLTEKPFGSAPLSGHAVRLVRAGRVSCDPLTGRNITEIAWADADALPFDLTVAAGEGRNGFAAFGNVVAADAGVTVLPKDPRGYVGAQLHFQDVVYSVPYDRACQGPASALTRFDPRDAAPAIHLETIAEGARRGDVWNARPDLLDSDRFARDFVAETDDSGVTTLRFGDGVHGMRPAPGLRFSAVYRTGRGGDEVGAYAIRSWEPRPGDDFVVAVNNPLAAGGGTNRQSMREIRRDAPLAYRNLLDCAIEQDFVAAAKADARVQSAVTQTRWIGSRHTIRVYVQRAGGIETDHALLAELEGKLDESRILGADVALCPPQYVPLQIALTITVQPSYARNAVRRQVAEQIEELYRFGRLSFGEPVHLSPLIARAMDVPGVEDVKVDAFHRFDRRPLREIEDGRIEIGPTEIAQLDNRAGTASRGRLIVNAVTAAPATRP